jgi:hypothetical protein
MANTEKTPETGMSLWCSDWDLGMSVRELESIASSLRLAGDTYQSETIDRKILSRLEEKIYRKIMTQTRRKRASA